MNKPLINYFKSDSLQLSIICGRGVSKGFPMHRHLTVSIGMVLKGSRLLTIYKRKYIIAENDVFVINSGEPHAIGSVCNPEHDYIVVSLSQALVHSYFPEGTQFNNIGECPELANVLKNLFYALIRNESVTETLKIEHFVPLLVNFQKDSILQPTENTRFSIVKHLLDTSMNENFTLENLAAKAYLSTFHFARLFKKITGLAPHQYLLDNRLRAARQMLEKGQIVSDVAIESGFYDTSHLVRHFTKYYGVSPLEFQKGTSKLLL